MLWQHYVYRRGTDVESMWEQLYGGRALRILYIAGQGFDIRAQTVMSRFVKLQQSMNISKAELLLLSLPRYQLSDELRDKTKENVAAVTNEFRKIGTVEVVNNVSSTEDDDISATNALQLAVEAVLAKITDQTDIVLDFSSLPRVLFLSLLTGILTRLVPNKQIEHCLSANGVNFQVVVAEDPDLDAQIRSDDPSSDLVTIPGFSVALHAEAVKDWPMVWFPMLGEGRIGQLSQVLSVIPKSAEICPVLPHPSRDPRRGDRLILEYKEALFDARLTPTSNILYAHEANPFEAYRQLVMAMDRYRESMSIMGGCRLVVTPLASKLMTIAAGLACYAMRPQTYGASFSVGMPYSEGQRYQATLAALAASKAEISAILLTGEAYAL